MRRTLQRGGVHRQDKADTCGREIDLLKAGDGAGYVTAQHVDGDGIAKAQADLGGFLGGKADQGRAVIVGRPPFALGDNGIRVRLCCVGHTPVTGDNPVITCHLFCWPAVYLCHDTAQHRRAVNAAHGGIVFQPLGVACHLALLDVYEEIAGCDGRQVAGDGLPQVAVNLADGGKHRQAQTQRQHNCARAFARTADGGHGPTPARTPAQPVAERARGNADEECGECEQSQRARDPAECPKRQPPAAVEPACEAHKGCDCACGGKDERRCRQAAGAVPRIAEQCRRAHAVCSGQWPEGEDESGQQAV